MSKFEPVGEKEVTRTIVDDFLQQFHEYAESDVIIVGAVPSGLMAGMDLAKNRKKVLIVERKR